MDGAKYVKIEWVFPDDLLPRIVGIPDDEDVCIDGDFLRSLEAETNNKILKAYLYQPLPKYLILYLCHLVGDRYPKAILALTLQSEFFPKDFESVAILKFLGYYSENEIIYESIRTAWQGYWKEREGTLYFEEFAVNHEQELISVLELLMNILSTVQMHYDSEIFSIDQTQISAN